MSRRGWVWTLTRGIRAGWVGRGEPMPWYQRLWEAILSWLRPVHFEAPPSAPMTWEESDRKAKELWGPTGWAANYGGPHCCRVGAGEHLYGWGTTYEEALKMAEVNHPPRKGGPLP